jgi:hypothetical protein
LRATAERFQTLAARLTAAKVSIHALAFCRLSLGVQEAHQITIG